MPSNSTTRLFDATRLMSDLRAEFLQRRTRTAGFMVQQEGRFCSLVGVESLHG